MSVLLVTETTADADRFRTALQSGSDGPCDVRVLGRIEGLLQEKGTREQGYASPSQECSTVAVVDWEMLRSYGEKRTQSLLEDEIPYPVLVLIRAEGESEEQRQAERQALRWGAQDCWCWHELLESGGAAIARDLEKAIKRYQRIKHLHQEHAQAHHQASFLRSVVEASPTLMAVKDAAGQYVVANSALGLLYGTTPARMIGCREIEINPNEAQARLHEREEHKVLQDGQRRETVQEPYKDSAGTIRWIQSVRQ
ncbi:MAG: PAS domain-containing protein, partial [Cyanobacteria bacterium P01_H01_bin.130]